MNKPWILCDMSFADRQSAFFDKLSKKYRIMSLQLSPTRQVDGTFHNFTHRLFKPDMGLKKMTAYFSEKLLIGQPDKKVDSTALCEQLSLNHRMDSYHVSHLERLHKKYQFKMFLVTNDWTSPLRQLVVKANTLGITTLLVQHSYFQSAPLPSYLRYPNPYQPLVNHIFIENSGVESYYEAFAAPHNFETHIVGDILDRDEDDVPVKNPSSRIIYVPAYISGSSVHAVVMGHDYQHKSFNKFCKAMQAIKQQQGKDFDIIVKCHPLIKNWFNIDMASYYEEQASQYGLKVNVRHERICYFLNDCTLLVCEGLTSSSYEALFFNIPSINMIRPSELYRIKEEHHRCPSIISKHHLQEILLPQDDLTEHMTRCLDKTYQSEHQTKCENYIQQLKGASLSVTEACETAVQTIQKIIE